MLGIAAAVGGSLCQAPSLREGHQQPRGRKAYSSSRMSAIVRRPGVSQPGTAERRFYQLLRKQTCEPCCGEVGTAADRERREPCKTQCPGQSRRDSCCQFLRQVLP